MTGAEASGKATGNPHHEADDNTITHNNARPFSAAHSVTSAGLPFAILEVLDAAGVTGRLLDGRQLSLRPASCVTPEVRAHVASNARAVADAVESRTRIAEMIIDLTQQTARVVTRYWPARPVSGLRDDPRLMGIECRINAAGCRLDFDAAQRGCDEYIAWVRVLVGKHGT